MFFDQFSHILTELSQKQSEIYIGLSGGTSCDNLYKSLMENMHRIDRMIREKIRWCFLDERIVPIGHPDSNEGQLRKKWLQSLIDRGIFSEQSIVSVGVGEYSALEHDMALHYSERVPRIDIALVGIGPDGHIASLFPQHPLLQSEEHGFVEIYDSPKPPPHRITTSPHMIRNIGYVFLVFRQGKESVWQDWNNPLVSVSDSPVKMLQDHPGLIVTNEIDNI